MAKVIEFPSNYVNNMVGKAVISIDGPGQSEKDPARYGKIIAEISNFFGDFWEVQWDNGSQDIYSKRTVKHINDLYGIGVYYK
ncbi:hypothetical protein ACQJZ4_07680 [Bacillus altitudinis]|uniref:hypothetical protein n=1 Tax=Bacillus altitudinis TaxID=293387 RepID=UPI003CF63E1E